LQHILSPYLLIFVTLIKFKEKVLLTKNDAMDVLVWVLEIVVEILANDDHFGEHLGFADIVFFSFFFVVNWLVI
jgi:hypothetical protein